MAITAASDVGKTAVIRTAAARTVAARINAEGTVITGVIETAAAKHVKINEDGNLQNGSRFLKKQLKTLSEIIS